MTLAPGDYLPLPVRRNHGPFGIEIFSRTNGASPPPGTGYGLPGLFAYSAVLKPLPGGCAGDDVHVESVAAIDAGKPWPLQRAPEPAPNTNPEAEPASAQPQLDDRAARLDQLLALADDTAQRLTAQRAERQASSEYAARLARQAQAEPEAGHQAEAREGFEIEM